MPKNIPPSPQQVTGVLQSALCASQELIQSNPAHIEPLRATFLQFYSSPVFQLILGIPTQTSLPSTHPNDSLKDELILIKSTLQTLSKTVTSLQTRAAPAVNAPNPPSKVAPSTQPPGKITSAPPTFAAKVATPTRPSLIVDLSGHVLPKEDRPPAADLCEKINERLHNCGHKNIALSAAKWMGKGNLVFTASPNITPQQFQTLIPDIKTLATEYLAVFIPDLVTMSRTNVKWSKCLLNGVPTGVSKDRGAHTPDECHNALNSHNPLYASLRITQKPSWVRTPSSYVIGSSSSLSFAFEDPDGSQLKSLLTSRQLYLLGTRAKVKRWKNSPPPESTITPATSTPTPAPSQPLTVAGAFSLPPLELDEDPQDDPPQRSPHLVSRLPQHPPLDRPAHKARSGQQAPQDGKIYLRGLYIDL